MTVGRNMTVRQQMERRIIELEIERSKTIDELETIFINWKLSILKRALREVIRGRYYAKDY